MVYYQKSPFDFDTGDGYGQWQWNYYPANNISCMDESDQSQKKEVVWNSDTKRDGLFILLFPVGIWAPSPSCHYLHNKKPILSHSDQIVSQPCKQAEVAVP